MSTQGNPRPISAVGAAQLTPPVESPLHTTYPLFLLLSLEIGLSIYHPTLPQHTILHGRKPLNTHAHRPSNQNHQTRFFLVSKQIHAEACIHLYASTEFTLIPPIHTSWLLLQCLEPTGLVLIRGLRIVQWIDPRLQSGRRFFSRVLGSQDQDLGFDVLRRMDKLEEIWLVFASSEIWPLEGRCGKNMAARSIACRERPQEGAIVAIKRTANEFAWELRELPGRDGVVEEVGFGKVEGEECDVGSPLVFVYKSKLVPENAKVAGS